MDGTVNETIIFPAKADYQPKIPKKVRVPKNVVMVEMVPHQKDAKGFLITESDQARFRPDSGTVVSSRDPEFSPGQQVLVRPYRGVWFRHFSIGDYRANTSRGEVRFYGTISANCYNPVFEGAKPIVATIEPGRVQAKKKWVFVKRDELKDNVNGIYIPDAAQSRTCRGTVVSVGSQVDEVKEGDYITYNGKGICNVQIEDVEYYGLNGSPDDYCFVPESELLAIIEA